MNIRLRGMLGFAGAALMISASAFAGCERSLVSAYCDKVCDCKACTGEERARCEKTVGDAQTNAGNKACGIGLDSALTCVVDEVECADGLLVPLECMESIDSYETCMGDPGHLEIAADVCGLYARHLVAKLAECGVQVSGDPAETAQCSAVAAKTSLCLDACLAHYDCACFADPSAAGCQDEIQLYSDCTAECQ